MSQQTLFGDGASEHAADLEHKRKAAGRETHQDRELARVTGAIADSLRAFREEMGIGREWSRQDLLDWLRDRDVQCGPDSPRRILSQLKKSGELDYESVRRGVLKFTK